MYNFNHFHLLDIESLNKEDIDYILSIGEKYLINKNNPKILQDKIVINLFFENSTRTLTSFELAAKKLGASVINMEVAKSSVAKGETLIDTAMNLNAMNPDFICIRHNQGGAPHLLASKLKCHVINGGDGCHEHPTQGLLDALTIKRKKGDIKGLIVAICGDILHSRVARSNMRLLKKLEAEVRLIAPKTLLPEYIADFGYKIFHRMEEGLEGADIVMMLRIQAERMASNYLSSLGEFFKFYGLTYKRLAIAKSDALVMHPGPINRGVEIDSDLADDTRRSIILDQVETGVAIRQAVFEILDRVHENRS